MVKNVFSLVLLAFLVGGTSVAMAQPKFTRADTLRGTITPERAWWDVQRYDLTVKPDYDAKSIAGKNRITYKVITANNGRRFQIDLKAPLKIDSIHLDGKKVSYQQDGNAWYANVPVQKKGTTGVMDIWYQGKVKEAVRPPWEGGWSFKKDSLNRPWMTVTCQGAAGASIWFPCKDHQSDEPDKGATLTMIVPNDLVGVSNGRLLSTKKNNDGTTSYTWGVTNPINNYCLIPYIGKYVNFNDTYMGEKGKLDLSYWVLDYNLAKAKTYFPKEVNPMMKAFEHWMGPYPFYEDSFKLIDAPHSGMEHQSAVAYGNFYKPGYGGRDGSGTGIGMKWDFIIVHETGHEWFGNNITTADLADMWVHEGFTNYSETMYVDYIFGKEAGNDYNYGIRRGIRNDRTIIPAYNVNAQGSGDMYPKASNMIHTIRHSINNDEKFRSIIRGLNKRFYHKIVTSAEVENYISTMSGFNYARVFDQYLRNVAIPVFEYKIDAAKGTVTYRYQNSIKEFNLPLVFSAGATLVRIQPTTVWKTSKFSSDQLALFNKKQIERMFYVKATELTNSASSR